MHEGAARVTPPQKQHWIKLFSKYSDEKLAAFVADARTQEDAATEALGRSVHRKRRLAGEKELRRRQTGQT